MNRFGTLFCIQIFGESHGPMVGVLIDGIPAGIPLIEDELLPDLERRKPGARGTTPRNEADQPRFQSGVFNGFTTGAPLLISFENQNIRSGDYEQVLSSPRPGHADFTSREKFRGYTDHRGGGHFSGRLTVGLVAAGVIAKKILTGVSISASVIEVGGRRVDIESAIEKALIDGDSLGGIVECRANGLPVGLGEPFFDSVESLISHLAFAIPAIKGIEFGSGFRSAKMRGSEHNDPIEDAAGRTTTNHSGGINGGITNGNELVFRVAVKPTSSIGRAQTTFDFDSGQASEITIHGRHDACIALRVPVVLEAITAIALADLQMQFKARN